MPIIPYDIALKTLADKGDIRAQELIKLYNFINLGRQDSSNLALKSINSGLLKDDSVISRKIHLTSNFVDVADLDQTHTSATLVAGSTITLTAATDGVAWCGFGGWMGGQTDNNGDLTAAFLIYLNNSKVEIGTSAGFVAYIDVDNEAANSQVRWPTGFFVPINIEAGTIKIELYGYKVIGTNWDITGRFGAFLTSTQII